MIPGVRMERTHSDDDVRGYIATSEQLLTEAGYDDAERIQLLPTIISLVSAKMILQQQPIGVDMREITGGRLTQ